MGDIITLLVGKCGNCLGQQFWETICVEHGIDRTGSFAGTTELQLRNITVYFRETRGLHYTPKAVLIDLDRSTMVSVRYSPYGQIFKPNNFVFGTEGTGNNWAKGHFTEGAELCESALDIIRKEAEACNYLREFETIHSIGGGTGAGLGSLLICKLNEEYPKKLVSTYSVIPSNKTSDFVVEPYNAVLTMHHLVDNTHKTYCMDNEALYKIASETLKLTQVRFTEVNCLMACAISGITSSVRFPGPLNVGYRKFIVNAVPFPRLHFFVPGLAPILRRDAKPPRRYTVLDITTSILDNKSMLAACDIRSGTFLTATCIFRGKVSTKDVEKQLSNMKLKNSSHFVEWIPNNFKVAYCNIPPPGFSITATFIGNTTAIREVFERVRSQFKKMFKKKAFLHWYLDEGMDQMEFEAAEAGLHELIEEYKDTGNLTV